MSRLNGHRWSDRVAEWVCARPHMIVAAAGALALAAIGLTAWKLEFQSDRNALIDPDLEWNRRYIDWWEGFANRAELLVIIDAGRPAAAAPLEQLEKARVAAEEIERELLESGQIERVFRGAPASAWRPKSARLLPMDEFELHLADARQAGVILRSDDAATFIESLSAEMQERLLRGGAAGDEDAIVREIDELAAVVEAIESTLMEPGSDALARVLALEDDTWRPLQTNDGRLTFLRVTPREREGSLLAADEAIETIREVTADVESRFPELDIGLTGVEVVESDETATAATDSAIASCIAIVLISVLLIVSFRNVVVPLLLMAALLTGVAWSFGFLTLSIGHLQVLSVVFVVILLGLGIDFGIHLVSALEQVRREHADAGGFAPALAHAYRRCGPGVIFGALTTAAAFFATTLTDFTGVAEMGVIACAGIVLCVIAMMTVLPVLLSMFRRRHGHLRGPDDGGVEVFRGRWLSPLAAHAGLVVIVTVIAVVLSLLATRRVRFDYDLVALLPRGVDSVRWQQRLAAHSDQSIWYGVSVVDDLEEAAARTRQFRALPTVGDVGGVGMLTPPRLSRKREAVALARPALEPALSDALVDDPVRIDEPPDGADHLRRRAQSLLEQIEPARQTAAVPEPIRAALGRVGDSCRGIVDFVDRKPEEERAERVRTLNGRFRDVRRTLAQRIDNLLDPAPLTPDDLPRELLHTAIDRTNPDAPRYALYIYPRVPDDGSTTSPLSDEFLPLFIDDVRSVDPHVTGVPVQVYESGDLIKRSFTRIGVIAFCAVLVLTWLTFRSLMDALLALAPVAVGFALTFGLMGLAGVNLNPANIIVLPLMFGIGVDAGIHIVHRVRADPGDHPLGLTHGTGKAITLTALTTMIGFASMMIARHRGIASLGLVMTTGLGLTLLACWIVMPALLLLRARWSAAHK